MAQKKQGRAHKRQRATAHKENSEKQRKTSSVFGGERCGAVFRFGHNLIAVEEYTSAKFDQHAAGYGIPSAA